MRILMVTSELVPLAKTGGLADMVAALAAELDAQGHEVRIVMPRYYAISRAELQPLPGPLGVPVGFGEEWGAVFETRLGSTGVRVYLLDHERYFGRVGIYGNKAEPDFADNVQRFTFLCRGALQLAKKLAWAPDVLHAPRARHWHHR